MEQKGASYRCMAVFRAKSAVHDIAVDNREDPHVLIGAEDGKLFIWHGAIDRKYGMVNVFQAQGRNAHENTSVKSVSMPFCYSKRFSDQPYIVSADSGFIAKEWGSFYRPRELDPFVNVVSCSRDGKLVAMGCQNSSIKVMAPCSFDAITLWDHNQMVTCISWAKNALFLIKGKKLPGNEIFVVGDKGGNVMLCHCSNIKKEDMGHTKKSRWKKNLYQGHAVNAIDFTSDDLMVSVGSNKRLCVQDSEGVLLQKVFLSHVTHSVSCMGSYPCFVTGRDDGTIDIWEQHTIERKKCYVDCLMKLFVVGSVQAMISANVYQLIL